MNTMNPNEEFYRIQKLPPYVFAVINEMKAKARAAGQDVVDLGMGNPDGATPRAIVSKLVEAARNQRNHRYSMSKGIPHLRQEIVKRYQANYGVELDPEKEAIVTIGAKEALAHLLFAVIGPGDTVVSPNPCYPIHQYGVIMAEGHVCMLAMRTPADFLNALEDLYRKQSKPPRMVLISFPHNPTTQCVDLDFFKEIVRLAHQHGTMVVHDFAYADLCFDGYKAPSLLQVDGAKEIGVEIFDVQELQHGGLAGGLLPGQCEDDRRSRTDQELSRLRRVPADSDRFDHRFARVRGRYQEDLRDVPETSRCSDQGIKRRGLAGGASQGDHVRVGSAAGAI